MNGTQLGMVQKFGKVVSSNGRRTAARMDFEDDKENLRYDRKNSIVQSRISIVQTRLLNRIDSSISACISRSKAP